MTARTSMHNRHTGAPCYFCGHPLTRYGSNAARILDLMAEDGGWWTARALSERLGVSSTTTRKAISRYRDFLESRRNPDGVSGERQYRLRRQP